MDAVRVALLQPATSQLHLDSTFRPSLEALQAVVGGSVEFVRPWPAQDASLLFWVNEEGKLKGLPANCAVCHVDTRKLLDVLVGNILISAINDEGDLESLSEAQLALLNRSLKFLPPSEQLFQCNKMIFI